MEIQKVNNTTGQTTKNKAKVAIGATVGTFLPIAIISKAKKGKLSFDIFDSPSNAQNLGAIAAVSGGSILGSLACGLGQDKQENKEKIKEGTFNFLKVVVPTGLMVGCMEAFKNKKGLAPKIAAPVIGIGLGMPIAQKAATEIDKKFIHKKESEEGTLKERKLKLKDYFVHVDDVLALLVLSKVPIASKLHADKLLAPIYAYCGYEAGIASKEAIGSEAHS